MSDRHASRPAQPLDRAERTVLAAVARALECDDPSLAAELSAAPTRHRAAPGARRSRGPRGRGWLEALLVVLGMAVLLGIVVCAGAMWGAAGIVVVAVSLVVAVVVLALMGDPRPWRR